MELDDELKNLPNIEEQHDNFADDDMAVSYEKKKKKKKHKHDALMEETKQFTKGLDFDEDDTYSFLLDLKKKHKKESDDLDGSGLFDTKGKNKKKIKNLEVKFKPESMLLDKQLKDADNTIAIIKELYGTMKDSKYRGVGKIMSDVLAALNTANSNKLNVIKEKNNLKKSIIDLMIKLKKDEKPEDKEAKSAEEYGAELFTNLFKQGRNNVINGVNNAQGTDFGDINGFDDFKPTDASNDDGTTMADSIIDQRLANNSSNNTYRTPQGSAAIRYENVHPEICAKKSFSTGKITMVAIDDEGHEIDDPNYPVPNIKDLEANGSMRFNEDAGTCTDFAGRVYRVIDVE